jgi:hypothetical protein
MRDLPADVLIDAPRIRGHRTIEVGDQQRGRRHVVVADAGDTEQVAHDRVVLSVQEARDLRARGDARHTGVRGTRSARHTG